MAYRGDPELCNRWNSFLNTKMAPSVGSHGTNLFNSILYELYCRSIPQLRPMVLAVVLANREAGRINHEPIMIVRPRMIGYMALRWFSFDWYAELGLPDEDTTTYQLKYRYGDR